MGTSKQDIAVRNKDHVGKRTLRLIRSKILLISLALIAALLILSENQTWSEWYATTIYPWFSSIFAAFSSLVPFSLAECVIVLGSIGIVAFLIHSIRAIYISSHDRGFELAKMATGILCIVSILFLLFMLLAGVNYHRKEFADISGLPALETTTYNAEDLTDLGTFLVTEMEQARTALDSEFDIYHTSPDTFSHYAQESVSLMQALQETYPIFNRPLYSTPKPAASSHLLCYANIAGIFFPFTVESNINVEDPLFTQPFTMAHELAHQAGFMREDEANFIAFLACMESDDPLTRYSGAYQAFVRALSILRQVDYLSAENLWKSVPDSIKEDNAYYSNFLKQYEDPVKEVSTKLNDTYLKANSQHDGVAAYDRMINLLLAWYTEQQ